VHQVAVDSSACHGEHGLRTLSAGVFAGAQEIMKKTVRRLAGRLATLLTWVAGRRCCRARHHCCGHPVDGEDLMPLDEYAVPITEGRFRERRAYLSPEAFADPGDGRDDPTDLIDRHLWMHLMDSPTDVLLQTTDHFGSTFRAMGCLSDMWISAITPDGRDLPLASIIHGGRWLALAVPGPALIGPVSAFGYDGGPAGGPGAGVSTGPSSLLAGCRDGFAQVRWAAEVRGYGATLS
jgi:hypothetical protein